MDGLNACMYQIDGDLVRENYTKWMHWMRWTHRYFTEIWTSKLTWSFWSCWGAKWSFHPPLTTVTKIREDSVRLEMKVNLVSGGSTTMASLAVCTMATARGIASPQSLGVADASQTKLLQRRVRIRWLCSELGSATHRWFGRLHLEAYWPIYSPVPTAF